MTFYEGLQRFFLQSQFFKQFLYLNTFFSRNIKAKIVNLYKNFQGSSDFSKDHLSYNRIIFRQYFSRNLRAKTVDFQIYFQGLFRYFSKTFRAMIIAFFKHFSKCSFQESKDLPIYRSGILRNFFKFCDIFRRTLKHIFKQLQTFNCAFPIVKYFQEYSVELKSMFSSSDRFFRSMTFFQGLYKP